MCNYCSNSATSTSGSGQSNFKVQDDAWPGHCLVELPLWDCVLSAISCWCVRSTSRCVTCGCWAVFSSVMLYVLSARSCRWRRSTSRRCVMKLLHSNQTWWSQRRVCPTLLSTFWSRLASLSYDVSASLTTTASLGEPQIGQFRERGGLLYICIYLLISLKTKYVNWNWSDVQNFRSTEIFIWGKLICWPIPKHTTNCICRAEDGASGDVFW